MQCLVVELGEEWDEEPWAIVVVAWLAALVIHEGTDDNLRSAFHDLWVGQMHVVCLGHLDGLLQAWDVEWREDTRHSSLELLLCVPKRLHLLRHRLLGLHIDFEFVPVMRYLRRHDDAVARRKFTAAAVFRSAEQLLGRSLLGVMGEECEHLRPNAALHSGVKKC